MHIVTILRYFLGLTQMELAEKSGVSFADINEMENKPAYGMIDKYRKVANYLRVPVHAIVTNDVLGVPEAFFDEMQPAEYIFLRQSLKTACWAEQGRTWHFTKNKNVSR